MSISRHTGRRCGAKSASTGATMSAKPTPVVPWTNAAIATATATTPSVAALTRGLLVDRRLVDAADRRVERLVELLLALLRGEAFRQRAREARDDAAVARKKPVRLVARVPAGQ